MTINEDRRPALTGAPRSEAGFEGLVRRAQLAGLWERLWPPLAAASVVLLAFLAASWFGLWTALPPLGRAIGLAVFAGIFAVALATALRSGLPSRRAALARIDRHSGLTHRPATTLGDTMASGTDDPLTRTLWEAHRERTLKARSGLTFGWPVPGLARRDPTALRFLVAIAAAVAFMIAGPEREARLLAAFDWSTPVAPPVPARLDAWVTPPGYTGRAPIFLTNAQAGSAAAAAVVDTGPVTVPAGSVLVLRVSGGDLNVEARGAIKESDEKAPTAPGAIEKRYVLEGAADVAATPAGAERVAWSFVAVPDKAPTIAFKDTPSATARNTLSLTYDVTDDYGVTAAEALVEPTAQPQDGKPAPRPIVEAPKVPLALPAARARSGTGSAQADVTEHPWAGARVKMTLVARDDGGNEGRSAPAEVLLPGRIFVDPLAKSLIEQRRKLALDVNARNDVLAAIDALSLYPERFTPTLAHFLGLRSAFWRLKDAQNDDQLRDVVSYLWEIAVRIEDGDLSAAERELKAAQEALKQALENGASEEEIRQKMQRLREAMNKFLDEYSKQAQKNQGEPRPLPPNARVMTQEDLQKMLDRMEELARKGSREEAQNMLSDLQQMLENLQKNRAQAMDQATQEMMRQLDELGDMIREQGKLRDQTFGQRRNQQGGQQGQQGQRGQQGQQGEGQEQAEGQGGEGQQGENGMGGLADRQRALRERLEELQRRMQGQGGEGSDALGEAGREMGNAEGELGQGDAGSAADAQGRALDALRRGAQALAQQMMGDGQEGQGEAADRAGSERLGPGQGDDSMDPLGRPMRSRRYESGDSVKVPGEIDAQRARRVIEELRRRLGESGRSRDELDYLERLLP